MNKRITIKDVAELSGFAVTTVSLVLNNKGGSIPEYTQQKILEAAKQLDYQPNYAARSLVTGKSYTIGVLIPDISNTFFAELVRHIQLELRKYNYDIVLCNSQSKMEEDLKYIKLLSSRSIDGLIMALSAESLTENNSVVIKELLSTLKVPYVFIDRYYDGETPKVYVDNEECGRRIGELLVKSGHRNIGAITGPASLNSSKSRLQGFKQSLKENGVELLDENVVLGNYDIASGERGAELLLKKPVTAIFAFNDLQAYGVLSYAKSHGVRIPEDVSLVGFDDLEFSSIIEPNLTTVIQPIEELSTNACEMLMRLINGTPCETQIKINAELVLRDSVKDVKK